MLLGMQTASDARLNGIKKEQTETLALYKHVKIYAYRQIRAYEPMHVQWRL